MAKAVPSSSNSLLLGILLLAGCARAAPDLPPVTMAPASTAFPADRMERCVRLNEEIITLRHEISEIEDVLHGTRHQEQVQGYLADVLFPPLLLAIDQHTAQKKALDDRQHQVDQRLGEEKVLQCPSPDSLAQH